MSGVSFIKGEKIIMWPSNRGSMSYLAYMTLLGHFSKGEAVIRH